MELGAAGLKEQPFRTHGRPLSSVSYASHQTGLKVLEDTCKSNNGLCLIQGPALSGKSTLLRQFVDNVPEECSVAMVDGDGLNTTSLLEGLLRQFGYVIEHSSTAELLGMLRVFALHQTAAHEAPILIIENTHALNPSALRALCELASLNVRGISALKLVLVSDRPLLPMLNAPKMEPLRKRLSHDYHLRPMSSLESRDYLYQKLRDAGSEVPEYVFPMSVCNELWRASGGWPGILDRVALLALARADTLPVSIDTVEKPALPKGTWVLSEQEQAAQAVGAAAAAPMLFLSNDGRTLQEIEFDQPRMLIGRSEHNDIPINSKFISRHHALLVRHGNATFLMDLNSTNGTFVNSKRISNHVLIHDDIVSLGNHRLKFSDPNATRRGSLDGIEFADTAIMKTLEDMRRLLAQENTEIMPAATENLPTTGL